MGHFRDMKFRMTPQRAAILDFLKDNESHPSAEDIYDAIKGEYPMLSLATVYNTLETLKGMGLVIELSIDGERRRYDPNTTGHHHLICSRCRRVVDIHMEFELAVPENVAQGFEITGRHVEFYGICPQCREEAG